MQSQPGSQGPWEPRGGHGSRTGSEARACLETSLLEFTCLPPASFPLYVSSLWSVPPRGASRWMRALSGRRDVATVMRWLLAGQVPGWLAPGLARRGGRRPTRPAGGARGTRLGCRAWGRPGGRSLEAERPCPPRCSPLRAEGLFPCTQKGCVLILWMALCVHVSHIHAAPKSVRRNARLPPPPLPANFWASSSRHGGGT